MIRRPVPSPYPNDLTVRKAEEQPSETRSSEPTKTAMISFSFRLHFAGDRTPGRRGSIGIQPAPVVVQLDYDWDTLARNDALIAGELLRAEALFMDWVQYHYPSHDLASWDARLGSPQGPVLSRYWSGFLASE